MFVKTTSIEVYECTVVLFGGSGSLVMLHVVRSSFSAFLSPLWLKIVNNYTKHDEGISTFCRDF